MADNKDNNKKVYDFDNDKSQGILKDYMSASKGRKTKTNEKGFIIPKINEKEFERAINNSIIEEQETIDYGEEETEEKEINFKKIFAGFLVFVIVLLICVFLWATNSDAFLLKKIIVNVGPNVSSGEVIAIASGDIGKNLFLASVSSIKKQLQTNPYVERVKIRRKLMDTLIIDVEERIPKAIYCSGDVFYTLDKNGFILDTNYKNNTMSTLINFSINNEYRVGDNLQDTDYIKFKNLVYLLDVAKVVNFDYNISKIWYEDGEDIRLYISDAEIEVLYGALKKEQANDKLLYLREVIKKAKEEGLKGSLNISFDDYHKSVLNSSK